MAQLNRRQFISRTAATAAAITVLPRHVLGGKGYVAPSDKLNIACIGTGTQGIRVMLGLLKNPGLHIGSVADPVLEDTRYMNWGKYELRNMIRREIDEPGWDKGVEGCRAGRLPARQIVEIWYNKQKGSGKSNCNMYEDYRELLEKEKDLDAVVVGSVDHQHAQIAVNSMKKGKHVLCQKPMTNNVYEARLMGKLARETGLATQVLTANSSAESTDLLCEMIWSGAIGKITKVHNWSTRPVWPSGFHKIPEEEPVPSGFNWDLWLGPAAYRPFSYHYTHTVFRSWYDFGTGAIGDMGCYSFDVIFRALKLGAPEWVESSASTYCDVIDGVPTHFDNSTAHPRAMTACIHFPGRGELPPVDLFWYDGGIKPLLFRELETDGLELPSEGTLYQGETGCILTEFHGAKPRLIPEARNKNYSPPKPYLVRTDDHIEDWIRACRQGSSTRANFEFAAPVTETLNLAVAAMRTRKKLYWDSELMKTNVESANKLLKREYRPGYEL